MLRQTWAAYLPSFEVDVEYQQRIGHLFGPLPPEMRHDTVFMDRIHSYIADWDVPKLSPLTHFTDHFGLVSDFVSECFRRVRMQGRSRALQDRVFWGGALSRRRAPVRAGDRPTGRVAAEGLRRSPASRRALRSGAK